MKLSELVVKVLILRLHISIELLVLHHLRLIMDMLNLITILLLPISWLRLLMLLQMSSVHY